MQKKGSNDVPETPQQRVMVERATAQMADYEARWLPLQQNMAKQIASMGAAGSPERLRAQGRAATETEAKFDQARGAVEKSLTNAGAGPGSSKFKLAVTGMGANEATSKGLGMFAADSAIDDAYTQGLGALTALGRGEKATALQGTSNIAAMSGRQAAQDAAISAHEAQGDAALMGQVAGMGLGAAFGPAQTGAGGPAGGYLGPNNMGGSSGIPGMAGGYTIPTFSGVN